MKHMSRIIIIILVGSILISSALAVVDNPSSWAEPYVTEINNNTDIDVARLMSGYQNKITRGDFAYLGVKLYEYYTGQELLSGLASFSDTHDEYVLKAKNAGIVNGYADGTYKPNNFIKRDELATLFANILRVSGVVHNEPSTEIFVDDALIASWAKVAVYTAKANGIINGVGENTFNPTGNATREQAIIMLDNAIKAIDRNLKKLPVLGVDKIILRDVESTVINGMKIDNVFYPFEPDESVLGEWVAVDVVEQYLSFNPKLKYTTIPLAYSSVDFYDDGRLVRGYTRIDTSAYPPKLVTLMFNWTWTKGLALHNELDEIVAERYFVATVNDKEYLFIELKNGDYTYRNAVPWFYVYERK